jgi:integrase
LGKVRGMTSDMVTIKLRYIVEDVDRHGNVRIYFRRNGRKIRIPEHPASEAFHRRYAELIGGDIEPQPSNDRTPKANTFRWLCVQFFGSPEYKRLDPRTQYTRRRIFEAMFDEPVVPGANEKFADFPLDRITPKALRVLRDRKSDLPGAADNRVRALRKVFKWAVKQEHMPTNPARDIEYVGRGSEGWHSWTPEELEQFERRHPIGSKARLALTLLSYTGTRRSDVVQLGPLHVREGWIRFQQHKTGVTVELPIAPALQEAINATAVVGASTFLTTQYGKAFTAPGFGNWFRDRCNEAGLPQCSAHGVRKASAARAAENGATSRQLMAMFGWLSMQEAERYTRAAERRRLAKDAPRLLKR